MTSVGRLSLLKCSTLGLSSWDLVLNWHPFDGISIRIKAWIFIIFLSVRTELDFFGKI
jgi:hypothetical protein